MRSILKPGTTPKALPNVRSFNNFAQDGFVYKEPENNDIGLPLLAAAFVI